MRLVVCGISAVLLSGCSWMGYDNTSYGGNAQQAYTGAQYSNYATQTPGYDQTAGYGQTSAYGMQPVQQALGPCQITSPTQHIPQGCTPEQVTLALASPTQLGPQAQLGSQAQAGSQYQYTTGGYGNHVGSAQSAAQYQAPEKKLKRPWLRGSFGLEIDHSVSGELYQPSGAVGPLSYNRATFAESGTSGVVISGDLTTTTYTSIPERVLAPDISFDDVYTAPLRITGGLEVILSDHATVFANAGYTRAEGKKGGGVDIVDGLLRTITVDSFDALGVQTASITNGTVIPNQTVAHYDYQFNDLTRVDFEVGARYYFNPIFPNQFSRTLTPFISASGGAAHYDETTVAENQRQLFLRRAFESTATDNVFYDVNFGTPTQIYDAQWVSYGALKAGLEWQMTPRTALAFEAGLKYETDRERTNGTGGDENFSIPIAIRGSYNF
ncbi:MAG: hypothetical protein COA69_12435 [Robiginitomaculum sp.]|nr:MAG: hypothetical protein COA69_12435 [Robiginitomaculum sp.]